MRAAGQCYWLIRLKYFDGLPMANHPLSKDFSDIPIKTIYLLLGRRRRKLILAK